MAPFNAPGTRTGWCSTPAWCAAWPTTQAPCSRALIARASCARSAAAGDTTSGLFLLQPPVPYLACCGCGLHKLCVYVFERFDRENTLPTEEFVARVSCAVVALSLKPCVPARARARARAVCVCVYVCDCVCVCACVHGCTLNLCRPSSTCCAATHPQAAGHVRRRERAVLRVWLW